MNHDEGSYGWDRVCEGKPDDTDVGPTERKILSNIPYGRATAACSDYFHSFFLSLLLTESFTLPIYFSLICFLSIFVHNNVLFVPHLILHPLPYNPPLLHHFTINLLYPLSISLKIKTKHVLCHIPSGTRRVARKIRGVQDQRQGQAWPQDPSHYRQILPR